MADATAAEKKKLDTAAILQKALRRAGKIFS